MGVLSPMNFEILRHRRSHYRETTMTAAAQSEIFQWNQQVFE